MDGFDALSQLSRYRRFLHNKNELKQSEIDCLFSLDERYGIAYIVLECENTQSLAEGRCIGLIQLIELENLPDCAEIALVVIDEYQNCGVGKLILFTVETEARKRKIKTFHFHTTSENRPLIAILNRTGWDISVERELGSVTYITKLSQDSGVCSEGEKSGTDHALVSYPTNAVSQGQRLAAFWFRSCLRVVHLMHPINQYFYRSK